MKISQMLTEFNNYTSGIYKKTIKKEASQLVFKPYRRERLNVNINKRIIAIKTIKKYLIPWHLFLSILLILPIPASWSQIDDIKYFSKKKKRKYLINI